MKKPTPRRTFPPRPVNDGFAYIPLASDTPEAFRQRMRVRVEAAKAMPTQNVEPMRKRRA